MNKILVYTFIAILLGAVTMAVPLAVLKPWDPILASEDSVNTLEYDGGTFDRNGMLASPELPKAAPSTESSGTVPQEPEVCDTAFSETGASSGLSSIGLMIVPSFLIALGTFVYLKKRMV